MKKSFVLRKNFFNKSFKHKLRTTYTLLMFVVLILICTFLYYQVENIVKPLISRNGLQVVDGEAQYLGELFANQGNMLEQLSSTETFRNGGIAVIKKEIDNQMDRHNDLWLSMKYRSVTGEEYDNNPGKFKSWVRYEQDLLAADKLTLISEPVVDNRDGEYITYIGTKVMDDNGKIKGLLIINVRVKQLMKSFLDAKTGQFSEMWFLDSKGKVIINPNIQVPSIPDIEEFEEQIALKPTGEAKISTREDQSKSLIYSQIPNINGLYIAVGIEHSESSDAMIFLLILIAGGAVAACLFIFVAANKMTNLVTKPLTRMVEIIQHTDGTNLIEIPNDLKASKDEIGILANTIDEMARNIRNNVQTLNSEIKERQKAEVELILLNDELECRVAERTQALTTVTHSLSISEDRFRIAMEASHIGLYDSDCNNNVLVNGIFLHLINAPEYKQGRIKESDWVQFNGRLKDYLYGKDLPNSVQLNEESLPMIGEDFYAEVRLKEDLNVWLLFIGQVIKRDETGKVLRFIGVLQNISERKRTEVELKAAMEEAEEASQAKSQFLANMSHEIRTPMNAIIGLTHLIGQSELKDSQRNYISKIEGASTALLRIINDILDFSKIEAGKLEIEAIKFNINQVLENISNLYTMSATDKGIDLKFAAGEAVPEVLIGDPLRLEQVLSNLTTNAIKFTDQGEVNVSVRVLEETDNQVELHFSVTDTGIGLTKDQIGRLFTAFTQADGSMTRKYGGTGLGLTISKQLVDLMKGEIWVESVYGQGASFQFRIQFDKALDIVKLNASKETTGNRVNTITDKKSQSNYQQSLVNKRILLVEDNDINQLVARDILEQVGVCVSIASNGEEALNHVRANKFDAVLMDVQMPIMDGYKATEILRKTYSSSELPIIAMTANVLRGDRERSIESGMNDYISKPIDPTLLFETLEKWLLGKSMKPIEQFIEGTPEEMLPVLDFENTPIRLGNKLEFYYDLLTRYSNNYHHLVEDLTDLRLNQQKDEAKRLIHTLKSVAGNIGAMKLSNFIVQLEEHYESYNETSFTKQLEILSDLNEELLKMIERVIPIKASNEKRLNSGFNLDKILCKLLEALERARAKEINDNMSLLIATAQWTSYSTQISEIKQFVDRYHYKEARARVVELRENLKESTNG